METKEKLKRGQRRWQGKVWDAADWKKYYYVGAVSIPVSGPVEGDWKDLRLSLKTAWSQATEISNWLTTEMYRADVRREAGQEKMPKMPNEYLYPAARARFPQCPTGTLSALMQHVRQKYLKKRYKIIWTCEESLPNYRYPVPFPVRAADWRLKKSDDDQFIIDCRLPYPEEDHRRVFVKLARGNEWRRQHAQLQQCYAGTAMPVEMSFYRQKTNSGDHRNGVVERDNGIKNEYRIMAKIVAWFPKTEKEKRGALELTTGEDELLRCTTETSRAWMYHGDHLRRWMVANSRNIQNVSDDRKFEIRKTEKRQRQYRNRYETMSKKFDNRMSTAIDQIASMVAGLADRCHVEKIIYDDTKRWKEGFRYFELESKIKYKLDRLGIEFVAASARPRDENTGCQARPENVETPPSVADKNDEQSSERPA